MLVQGALATPPTTSAIPFDLGAATDFALISLGSDFILNGESRSSITGNVGVSAVDLNGVTASSVNATVDLTFQKGAIDGDLFLETGVARNISSKVVALIEPPPKSSVPLELPRPRSI